RSVHGWSAVVAVRAAGRDDRPRRATHRRGQDIALTLRLILADDHPVVREGVRALLEADGEFEVVGQASDGGQVADLVERLHPDVVVLDLMMLGKSGLTVTRSLAERSSAPPVLILTMHDSAGYVVEALRSGAT